MDRIWLAHYPAGVPREVDTSAYASLADMFAQSCARYRNRPAFRSMGTTPTYGDVDRRTRELERQLVDSGAKAIVVLENFARTLQEVVARTQVETVITTQLGDLFPPIKARFTNLVVKYAKKMVPRWHIDGAVTFKSALAAGRRRPLDTVALTRDDIAFLQYTGGTIGVPKGAMLSHGDMVADLQQISAWIGTEFREGAEIVVTPLPLYHVFVLTANLLTFFKWGALNVLIANPRDIPGPIAELGRVPFTAIAGAPLIEGYGLTEASPLVAGNPRDAQELLEPAR